MCMGGGLHDHNRFSDYIMVWICCRSRFTSVDTCFCHTNLLSLPNKVWETYCFCSISYYYYYYYYSYAYSSLYSPFFLWHMNLSKADLRNYWTEFHETWLSYRYMFLVGPKFFSFVVKGVKAICLGVTIESYGKVEISYINVDNF